MGAEYIYIAKQLQRTYKYAGIRSVQEYFDSYSQAVVKNARNKIKIPIRYHECIPHWSKRRIYFDIDYKDTGDMKFDERFIGHLVECCKEEVESVTSTAVTDQNFMQNCFLLCASGDVGGSMKHSYHLVITGYFVESSVQNRIFAENVTKRLSERAQEHRITHMLSAIDAAVYSPNHLFRLAGSDKVDSKRILEIKTFNALGLVRDYNLAQFNTELEKFEHVLRNTFVQSWDSADIQISYNTLVPVPYDIPQSVTQETIDKVLVACDNSISETNLKTDGKPAFVVQEVNPSRIIFKRVDQSFCDICARHHNSCGMQVFFSETGLLVRSCFRAPGKFVNIGNYLSESHQGKKTSFYAKVTGEIDTSKLGLDGDKMIAYLAKTMGLIIGTAD